MAKCLMCAQMAPYNTQYERLPVHMARAGVTAEPNLWDRPVSLGREHRPATPDSDSAAAAAGKARLPFTLLPPDKLLPLMVPFKGGPGPLCGGAASGGGPRCEPITASPRLPCCTTAATMQSHRHVTVGLTSEATSKLARQREGQHARTKRQLSVRQSRCREGPRGWLSFRAEDEGWACGACRMSADVGSFVGLADSGASSGAGPLAPSPFRLPAAYEEAKERKVAAVSDLRNAVKAVRARPYSPLHTPLIGITPLMFSIFHSLERVSSWAARALPPVVSSGKGCSGGLARSALMLTVGMSCAAAGGVGRREEAGAAGGDPVLLQGLAHDVGQHAPGVRSGAHGARGSLLQRRGCPGEQQQQHDGH